MVNGARFLAVALLVLPGASVEAQKPAKALAGNQGRWFLYWGYNRSWYTKSDIHFEGDDHDFTLRNVTAHDRATNFDAGVYFSPSTIWVPQYNYRLGWFWRERWSFSLGMDHMKYVVDHDQTVHSDGYARLTGTGETSGLNGSQEVRLTEDVLRYEHTDGLNLISFDADHYDLLWKSVNGRHHVQAFGGLHAGAVVLRSDVRLFGEGQNNRFNLGGWGAGAQAGVHATFFDHVFLRSTVRGGYIDLLDVLTTGDEDDRASQHFWFAQWSVVLGAQFRLK